MSEINAVKLNLYLPQKTSADIQDWLLPYPNPGKYPYVDDWTPELLDTWEGAYGYKAKYIDAYETDLVHDPSQTDNSQTSFNEKEWATSEGQGYGMLRALFMNDQTYFDKIFDAAQTYMYNINDNGLYAWKVDRNGNYDPDDYDSATDGYALGLAPDWCTANGDPAPYMTSGPSGNGYDMWYDGIRVPWRIAIDAIWNNESRAVEFLNNGMNFVNDENAAMYLMNGTIAPGSYHYVLSLLHFHQKMFN
jgi:endo-1,4-beta-D-glucanase Y